MRSTKKIKMVILDVDGTMTDGGIYITEEGLQFKKYNVHDGMGIQLMLKAGVEIGIISHSLSSGMVMKRAAMLGIKHCYVGKTPKEEVLRQWSGKLNIGLDEMAYIGDDINDIEAMQMVAIGACPANAIEKVKAIADVVLSLKGGEGCVREFADKYVLI